jgi:hypothetical protein
MSDHDDIRQWLTSVPYSLLAEEVGKRNNARRKIHAGGKPKVLRPCKKCGAMFGARELRKHTCSITPISLINGVKLESSLYPLRSFSRKVTE